MFKLGNTGAPFIIVFALCFLPYSASAFDHERFAERRIDGNFISPGQTSTVIINTVFNDTEDKLVLKHPGLKSLEIEIRGAVQSVSTCFSENQTRDNLVISVCDGGNGPNCHASYVYVDTKKKALAEYAINSTFGELAIEVDADDLTFCRWERTRDAEEAFETVLTRWSPRNSDDYYVPFANTETTAFAMPVKSLTPQQVAAGLTKLGPYLSGPLIMETLAEDDQWRLSAVSNTATCNGNGIVIAYDKTRKTFTALYHIPSGCSKALNYPPHELHLNGNTLTGRFCTYCEWHGKWAVFNWDLLNHQVQRINNLE
jgi:hypothetical protein